MKRCRICLQELPLSMFYKKSTAKDGHRGSCKNCFVEGGRPHAHSLQEYFFRHVTPGLPDECWPWTGGKAAAGYGHFRFQNDYYLAHRVAWSLHHGEIPDGLDILHTCDFRPCVNWIKHLFPGTNYDNTFDAIAKGRHVAKLNEAKVIEMRNLRRQGLKLEALALIFDVTVRTVWDVCACRRYKHIP